MHEKHEKGWAFAHTSIQKQPTAPKFCKWLAESLEIRPERLFAKPDFNGILVDDVHLALESEQQPTALGELFRSMLERKGTLSHLSLYESKSCALYQVRVNGFIHFPSIVQCSW